MYKVQSGQIIEKDFCFVWVNSILLTTNTFPISSQSAQMKWVNLGVSGCRPLFSMRDIRTAEYFIGHISAENTIVAASNNKCVAWRELKKKIIKLNYGSFNMSTMFARYCFSNDQCRETQIYRFTA